MKKNGTETKFIKAQPPAAAPAQKIPVKLTVPPPTTAAALAQNTLAPKVPDPIEISRLSANDILSSRFNLFLETARQGAADSAKALIRRLQQQKISTDSIIHFFCAVDNGGKNAWILATTQDSADFFIYLYELKSEFANQLPSDWGVFQKDSSDKNAIYYSLNPKRDEIIKYLLFRTTILFECLKHRELKDESDQLLDHIQTMTIDQTAEILVQRAENKQTLLSTALLNRHPSIIKLEVFITKCVDDIVKFSATNRSALLLKPFIKKMLEIYLPYFIDKQYLNSQKDRNTWAGIIAPTKYFNTDQEGRLPYNETIITTQLHNFHNERERQLLRQIATQLFFGFQQQIKSKTLKEIQVMHIRCKGTNNIIIAVNEYSAASAFVKFLKTNPLKKILCTDHKPSDKEGALRSKRYAEKLTSRIYDRNQPKTNSLQDSAEYNYVANIIAHATIEEIPVLLQLGKKDSLEFSPSSQFIVREALKQDNRVFIINHESPLTYFRRHAEEFLVDVRECVASEADVYTCVAGKKRPCMGCTGRMKGHIDQYGQRPGLFWLHSAKYQAPKTARETLRLLMTEQTHITRSKNNKDLTEYDSGSDSEIENSANKP